MRLFFLYPTLSLRKFARIIPGAVAFIAFLPQALAQPDHTYNFNPGRPGFTYGTSPLIRHTLSVESFVCLRGETFRPWKESYSITNRYMLRYSPFDRMEIGIGTGLIREAAYPDVSLSPLSMMAKVNILRKGSDGRPGLAVVGSLTLPVGSGSQYAVSRGVSPSLVLVSDHSFKHFWLTYNLGAEWNVANLNTGLFYAIMAGGSPDPAGRWGLYGEFVGDHYWNYRVAESHLQAGLSKPENSFLIRVGGDFFITECFKFDFSLATRLHAPHILEGEIGFSYGIPLKKASKH